MGRVAFVVAVHITGLSLIAGFRHSAYLMVEVLSGAFLWSCVLLIRQDHRRIAYVVGALLSLAIQQTTYHLWKADMPGFWGALIQFANVQYLIGYAIARTVS